MDSADAVAAAVSLADELHKQAAQLNKEGRYDGVSVCARVVV
jgi:hypothetical protein